MHIAFNLAILILVISPKTNGAIMQRTGGEVIRHRELTADKQKKAEKEGGRARGKKASKDAPNHGSLNMKRTSITHVGCGSALSVVLLTQSPLVCASVCKCKHSQLCSSINSTALCVNARKCVYRRSGLFQSVNRVWGRVSSTARLSIVSAFAWTVCLYVCKYL